MVRFDVFDYFPDMMFHKFSALLVSFSFVVLTTGCNCFNDQAKPTNPFAQNVQTVPPLATFSSQDSYLGQTPGTFVPQTPATTFPSGSVSPAQPAGTPSDISLSDAVNSGEKATLFTPAGNESGWTAVEVAATSQTAFQAMEAKVKSASLLGSSADADESLVVGASHIVTTIMDESQSATALPEPQLLYTGQYAE